MRTVWMVMAGSDYEHIATFRSLTEANRLANHLKAKRRSYVLVNEEKAFDSLEEFWATPDDDGDLPETYLGKFAGVDSQGGEDG